jgi:hypothetical protein
MEAGDSVLYRRGVRQLWKSDRKENLAGQPLATYVLWVLWDVSAQWRRPTFPATG